MAGLSTSLTVSVPLVLGAASVSVRFVVTVPATSEVYTLPLLDALPRWLVPSAVLAVKLSV